MIWRDFAPGSRLSVPDQAPRRLCLFLKIVNALCWYNDFHTLARFVRSKRLGAYFFRNCEWLLLVSGFSDSGEIWLLAHAFGPRSKRLGTYFSEIVNALCWYIDVVDFGNILFLAHACRPRSKRLGAYLFFRNCERLMLVS